MTIIYIYMIVLHTGSKETAIDYYSMGVTQLEKGINMAVPSNG